MGLFKSLKARIFGGEPNKPARVFGRREEQAAAEVQGQAARRRKLLERRVESGESEEVYENRKTLDVLSTGVAKAGESPYVDDFLDGFILSRFASSNVWALQYDRTKDNLYVQFMGGTGKKKKGPGKWYVYSNVSLQEAKVFFNAASKGISVWKYLRRGKKNFTPVSGPPSYLPLSPKKRRKGFFGGMED